MRRTASRLLRVVVRACCCSVHDLRACSNPNDTPTWFGQNVALAEADGRGLTGCRGISPARLIHFVHAVQPQLGGKP